MVVLFWQSDDITTNGHSRQGYSPLHFDSFNGTPDHQASMVSPLRGEYASEEVNSKVKHSYGQKRNNNIC